MHSITRQWQAAMSALVGALLLACSASASFVLPTQYSETFDTAATSAQLAATYPQLAFSVSSGAMLAEVTGGVFEMSDDLGGPASDGDYRTSFSVSGRQRILANVGLFGSGDAAGNVHIGLTINNRRFIFHPGFTTGAFRFDGQTGNLDMGFTPALNVMHAMEVTYDGINAFNVKITDGSNPSNVFNYNATLATAAGPMGFTYAGSSGTFGPRARGALDNLVIQFPEPAMMGLGILAAFPLMRRRCR